MTELEKKIKIEEALSKLSKEEVELLGYKDFKLTPEERGYFILEAVYECDNYCVDSVVEIDLDNPFLDAVVDAIRGLKEYDMCISFRKRCLEYNLKENNITQQQYDLLNAMLRYEYDKVPAILGFECSEDNLCFAYQFENLVRKGFGDQDEDGDLIKFTVK